MTHGRPATRGDHLRRRRVERSRSGSAGPGRRPAEPEAGQQRARSRPATADAGDAGATATSATTNRGPVTPSRSTATSTCGTRGTDSSGSADSCPRKDDVYISVKQVGSSHCARATTSPASAAGQSQREEPGDGEGRPPSTVTHPRRPGPPPLRGSDPALPRRAAAHGDQGRRRQHDGADHRSHRPDRQGPARADRVAAQGGQDDDHEADRQVDRAQQPRGRT